MYYAEYNLHDDRLKLFIGDGPRLPKEEYFAAKKQMGAYWRGSGCLTGVWTPAREDFVLQYVDEIEEIVDDDCGFEYRLERFGGYSDKAEIRAEGYEAVENEIAERFAGGQPILVGHHSEAKARRDQKRLHSAIRHKIEQWDLAGYWSERVKRAERHKAYLERPDVIRRRVKKIEKRIRDHKRKLTEKAKLEFFVHVYYYNAMGDDPGEDYQEKYPDAHQFVEAEAEMLEARWAEIVAYQNRWLEHLQMVLNYQQQLYEQAGLLDVDKGTLEPEVGGAVNAGHWLPIVRVNQKTVTVMDTFHDPESHAFERKVELAGLTSKRLISKADYEATPGRKVYGDTLKATWERMHKVNNDEETGEEVVIKKGMGIRYKVGWHARKTFSEWAEVVSNNQKSVTLLKFYKNYSGHYLYNTTQEKWNTTFETMPAEEWQQYRKEHLPEWEGAKVVKGRR